MIFFWKKNRFFGYILLLISFQGILGQNDLINHKKYWFYKSRLNNDFVKIGNTNPNGNGNDELSPDHGESIPFNERVFSDHNGNMDYSAFRLRAGDASARLGIYIATLATEYKLLKIYGQNVAHYITMRRKSTVFNQRIL